MPAWSLDGSDIIPGTERGKTESQIVEEALRQYLKTDDAERDRQSIRDLFDRIAEYQKAQGVPPLTDEEAMQLANEEVHAMRAEKRKRNQAQKAG
jgi:hypothetical protein